MLEEDLGHRDEGTGCGQRGEAALESAGAHIPHETVDAVEVFSGVAGMPQCGHVRCFFPSSVITDLAIVERLSLSTLRSYPARGQGDSVNTRQALRPLSQNIQPHRDGMRKGPGRNDRDPPRNC
jgi:hypothetical protein